MINESDIALKVYPVQINNFLLLETKANLELELSNFYIKQVYQLLIEPLRINEPCEGLIKL